MYLQGGWHHQTAAQCHCQPIIALYARNGTRSYLVSYKIYCITDSSFCMYLIHILFVIYQTNPRPRINTKLIRELGKQITVLFLFYIMLFNTNCKLKSFKKYHIYLELYQFIENIPGQQVFHTEFLFVKNKMASVKFRQNIVHIGQNLKIQCINYLSNKSLELSK